MPSSYSSLIEAARQSVREGEIMAAETYCRQALRMSPQDPEARLLLGNLYLRQQRLVEATAELVDLLRIDPSHWVARNNLGVVLAQRKQLDQALTQFDEALRLSPGYVDPAINRGKVLSELGRYTEAILQLRAVLSIRPDIGTAHLELAEAYCGVGRLENAIYHYERAVAVNPQHAEAHWNLAMARLALGDYMAGWREYEWRWKCEAFAPFAPSFSQPVWDGSPLDGRTILLTAEQGLGDTLQFVRYAKLVKQTGAEVLLRCPRALEKILRSYGPIDGLFAEGCALPEFHCHLSLLSLPRVLGTTLATIPAEVPYLYADSSLVARWREELHNDRLRIGFAWQGSTRNRLDGHRSIPATQFLRLTEVAGVRLYSLQKGTGREQLAAIPSVADIIDLGGQIDESTGAFMDTAAVMQHLHLVVTCDTAIAHLAGALAIPVWLALSTRPDWRWMLRRDESPWYPTMRIFRQTEHGNWDEVFLRMRSELEILSRQRTALHGNGRG
ncbi:MAG: tetratricopeptide repeat protein [Pirellulaceae bacterium]